MSDCPHCLRHYERKVYLDRHVGMCQLLTKTKRERKLEVQEQEDTPSVRDLYTAVLELTEKYSQLEKKFTDLSKYATIKKQKINPQCHFQQNDRFFFIFYFLFLFGFFLFCSFIS